MTDDDVDGGGGIVGKSNLRCFIFGARNVSVMSVATVAFDRFAGKKHPNENQLMCACSSTVCHVSVALDFPLISFRKGRIEQRKQT